MTRALQAPQRVKTACPAPLPAGLRAEVVELLAHMVVKDLREHPRVEANRTDPEGGTTVTAVKVRR